MNLQNCLQYNPFQSASNFEGRIDTVYKGINGVKNKTDQAKIKIDCELINLRFDRMKSVFSCISFDEILDSSSFTRQDCFLIVPVDPERDSDPVGWSQCILL